MHWSGRGEGACRGCRNVHRIRNRMCKGVLNWSSERNRSPTASSRGGMISISTPNPYAELGSLEDLDQTRQSEQTEKESA